MVTTSPAAAASAGTGTVIVPIEEEQTQFEGAEGTSRENLEGDHQDPPTESYIWRVILSPAYNRFLSLVENLKVRLGVSVVSHREGSLFITVTCSSLEILEGLWEDYTSGNLNKVIEQTLVTPDVLDELGLTELKLETTITEEEYKKCKDLFFTRDKMSPSNVTAGKPKTVDEIDDLVEMIQLMTSLEISLEGCRSLDEMKLRVNQKVTSFGVTTGKEPFSVLTEAKKEDESKRATLYKFYKDTEVCLNRMDDKVRSLLGQNTGLRNLKDKIALHKHNLERKEYIVLVAGETSSGKSTLLNLILGEQILPHSVLSTTSTICELKYGTTPKLVVHFKEKNPQTGIAEETVWLSQSMEASQQSYLEQISSFVHQKSEREKGSNYKKIEIFWPHSLLEQGIVLVDSPGIGESQIMDDMVKEYLPEAFAFIYVINTTNAGGIQPDRIERLLELTRKISLYQQTEFSPTRALFVCNKWDCIRDTEADAVKSHIIKKLKRCWPNLDPESQIIYMSSATAMLAQSYGFITQEFAGLMNGIKSMVLKSIEARLHTQWRWLDYLLSRMAYLTGAFIRNSHYDRAKATERLKLITERLTMIKKQQSSVAKELQDYLEYKTGNAVSLLSKNLKSPDVVGQFTSWTLDDAPDAQQSWVMTNHYIQKVFRKRLGDMIAAWEEEHHVFADARTSMIEYFQQRFSYVEGQLRHLESSVVDIVADDTAISETGLLSLDNLSSAEKVIVGVTSPIWVPIGLVALVVSSPVVGLKALVKKREHWLKMKEFKKDKRGFLVKASEEFLSEAAEERSLRSYVVEQLKECQFCLRQVVARIPELIDADEWLCQQLRDEIRSEKEIADFYQPLYQRSLDLRSSMALFDIQEVHTMEISCDDLVWKEDRSSLLGRGKFASVYRGKLKGQKGEQPVALKVKQDKLNSSNVNAFLAETEALRNLPDYPFIQKFYGAALLKEGEDVRGILVLELCKENLRRHIFLNPENISGISTDPATRTNVIRWAGNIANALQFLHEQGIFHLNLKLENVLLSPEDVVKVADVGVAVVGVSVAYTAPEVIRSSMYDRSKADIYSFGITMWEMWYGKRAFFDEEDLDASDVAKGKRPLHVEDNTKPPIGWQHLMERCWDGNAKIRPAAAMCHNELTFLYRDAVTSF